MVYRRSFRAWLTPWLLLASMLAAGAAQSAGRQTHLEGPAGSVSFGAQVAALPNGNLVVIDPHRPPDGAAYLYSARLQLISTVTNIIPGTHPNAPLDTVRIKLLANGNYLLVSTQRQDGAGMVAWGSATTGISGSISPENALLGARENDLLGFWGVHALANGNYIVRGFYHDDEGRWDSITWGSGQSGVSGYVTADNSLLSPWINNITPLTNGNYVVVSPTVGPGGAMTWVDGSTVTRGHVDPDRSMRGSTTLDFLRAEVHPLANGNYVAAFPYWDNGALRNAGAALWAYGAAPAIGVVSPDNALVGTREENYVGYPAVKALANGNYVVRSSDWEGDVGINRGAATWGDGTRGISGAVSEENSLIGAKDFEFIGDDPYYAVDGVVALANGHYVVASPRWGDARGAVTWGDGAHGTVGVVSAQNSLIGTKVDHQLGVSDVTPLTNGNYVVASAAWQDEEGQAIGTATWVDGRAPRTGTVTTANSLFGSRTEHPTAYITALANGHYVVSFLGSGRNGVRNTGAVAWGNGRGGTAGEATPENALVGARENDWVGSVTPLTDGNYVVCSHSYSTATVGHVGAITWGSGSGGLAGEISASNSLLGISNNDQVCRELIHTVPAVAGGRYVIASLKFDNGAILDAGAVTFGEGPLTGHVNHDNSVIGTVAFGGDEGGSPGLVATYDEANARMVAGRFASNRVTLMASARNETPRVLKSATWWNPAEPGWGLFTVDQGNLLAPGWFTYDEDGEPTWFLVPGAVPQGNGTYVGEIQRFTGVPFDQIVGSAADAGVRMGTAILAFEGDDRLVFTTQIEGVTTSRHLERFAFGTEDIVCRETRAPLAAATNVSDLWWSPEASGWGLHLSHVNDSVFATWYTYDPDREAVFLVGATSRQTDGSYQGPLYRQRDGIPYTQIAGEPASRGTQSVGTMGLRFLDGERAVFSYSIGGITQTRNLARLRFGNIAAHCESSPRAAAGEMSVKLVR